MSLGDITVKEVLLISDVRGLLLFSWEDGAGERQKSWCYFNPENGHVLKD